MTSSQQSPVCYMQYKEERFIMITRKEGDIGRRIWLWGGERGRERERGGEKERGEGVGERARERREKEQWQIDCDTKRDRDT